MRERPPPQREGKLLLETEFVLPLSSICFRLGIGHNWQPESDDVKVCTVCDAEWWKIPDEQTGEAS